MDDIQIGKVAAVLADWNPLGSRAHTVHDLDGYRTEAIDIIMALALDKKTSPERIVSEVLNQAFELNLKPADCAAAASKIHLIVRKTSRDK